MLGQLLLEQPELGGKSNEVQALMVLIERRRTQLQLCAKSLGQRVYAERPKAFVSRIETYWQAWQSESKQPWPKSVLEELVQAACFRTNDK